jgi:hypothetical protein
VKALEKMAGKNVFWGVKFNDQKNTLPEQGILYYSIEVTMS